MFKRVAFIFTHRIQYFTNLLDELCKRGVIEPLAIYARETGEIDDPGFARRVNWDNRSQINCREIVLAGKTGGGSGLRHALASFQPDIVHLNGYGDIIQWQGWWWAKSHSVPIFLRGDGDTLDNRTGPLRALKRKIARTFTRPARIIFYQGEENKKFWIENEASPDRMRWIPCVSDTEVFQKPAFLSSEERLKFRQTRGAGNEDVLFLVSGKLIERKRPADVIRALSQLAATNTHLWFLGSGPLEEDLKRLTGELGLNNRVVFWGFQNQTQMPSILQAADVLVHAAEHDPWPYAILEGAQSGLALIVSDRTGSAVDWIDTHRAGLQFRCGDVNSLTSAMTLFASDTAKRSEWRKLARAGAQAHTEANFCAIVEQAVLKETGS
jgi:glycosyltransferase involved in cell wall biosynthesis